MILSDQELKSITTSVSSIVVSAGAVLAHQFNHVIPSKEKTSPHDLVTKFDKEGEEFLFNKLNTLYPEYGFLGEEAGYRNFDETKPFWIVDPIDGTLNFANNIPAFSVSVALVHHGKTYVGVCYSPISKELFTAYRGGGAFLNNRPITVSTVTTLPEAILSITPDQIHSHRPTSVIRRQGSSVLDLCYVAKGALDGYYDSCLNPWDFAAASLIIEEAGGEIFSLKNKFFEAHKKSDICAANKHLSDPLSKWILSNKL